MGLTVSEKDLATCPFYVSVYIEAVANNVIITPSLTIANGDLSSNVFAVVAEVKVWANGRTPCPFMAASWTVEVTHSGGYPVYAIYSVGVLSTAIAATVIESYLSRRRNFWASIRSTTFKTKT